MTTRNPHMIGHTMTLGEMEKIHHIARKHLGASQRRQKRDYDVQLREHRYHLGDLVYRLNSASKIGQSSKLNAPWDGPLLVVEVISPVLYRVSGRKRDQVIHHDRLKPCPDREIPLWIRRKRHVLLSTDIPDPEVEVSSLSVPSTSNNAVSLSEEVDSDHLALGPHSGMPSPPLVDEPFQGEDANDMLSFAAERGSEHLALDPDDGPKDSDESCRIRKLPPYLNAYILGSP